MAATAVETEPSEVYSLKQHSTSGTQREGEVTDSVDEGP